MASGTGEIIFDFGAAPGTNVVQTAVSVPSISASSDIEIYLSGLDSTAEHNAYEHSIVMLAGGQIAPISRTPGVGFTGQFATNLRLTGTIKCRYVFADAP